jgi:TetR/AcrR family transcriptional regulator, acrAB operon repressor
MRREAKSERSQRQVLDAGLQLFSHQGYRATTIREIAEQARVSTGNVYHHFPDKHAIFNALLEELWAIWATPRFPFRRVLSTSIFPDNLEQLGFAARESVIEFRQYIALVYVDMIEFDGKHTQKFYGEMAQTYAELLKGEGSLERVTQRMRPGVSPVSALLLTTRIYFNYFTIEVLFNVPEPFGKESRQVVKEIADILRHGILA